MPVNETVILVTESRTLAMGMSALLLSIPPIHHVAVAPDATAFYDAIKEDKPLLILIDTAMFEHRLPEILHRARQLSPQSLYILLSDDTTETRELADHAGITVIMKGTDPRRLARILETLLSEHMADHPPASNSAAAFISS